MRKMLVLLLLAFPSYADDTSTLKFLQDEPATLLDIGMVRLDNLTREFERRVGMGWTTASGIQESFRPDVNSYYDAKADKIYVSFFAMNSVATDAQMKEGCEEAMGQMTIWILKSLPGLFMHTGFDNADEAAREPYEKIADLFELTCYISSAHDSSIGRFWARKSLRETELRTGPWPMQWDQEPPAPDLAKPGRVEDCYARKDGRALGVPCLTYPPPPARVPALPGQQ